MTGVIIMTHGDFGKKLMESAEMICGAMRNTVSLGYFPGENMEAFAAEIDAAMDEFGLDEFLFLVDMLGGTPSNSLSNIIGKRKIGIITGVNLPMLMGIHMNRALELEELTVVAENHGKNGIVNILQKIENPSKG